MCYTTQLSTLSVLLMALVQTPTVWIDSVRPFVQHWRLVFGQPMPTWRRSALKETERLHKARVTYQQARRLFEQGDVEAALSLAHVARDLYADTKDNDGLGYAEQLIAEVFNSMGQPELAMAALQRATAVFKQPEDDAQALVQLAAVAREQGRVDDALRALRQAVARFKRLRQPERELEVVKELGYLLYEQGAWAEAERTYRRALRLAEWLRLDEIEDSLMLEIGNALAQQGKAQAARAMFERSIDSAKATGDRATLAAGLHSLAITYVLAEDYPQAETLFRNSLRLSQEMGAKLGMAYTLYEMGLTQAAQGRPDQARQLIERAGELYAELDAPEVEAVCWMLEQLELFEPAGARAPVAPVQSTPERPMGLRVMPPQTATATR